MTWEDLKRATACLCSRLPEASDAPWLVAADSNFHFAAALLACWQRGITAMLSPDTQPGTLELMRPQIGGCITDHAVDVGDVPVIRVAEQYSAALPVDLKWIEPRPGDVAMELFTSGSTGQRRRIPKTFAQLDHELAAWEETWANEPQGQPVLATVSHFHIYGLLFGVLRPLCRGDVMHGRNYFFWEELLPRLPEGPCMIVSSPVHLRHLPQVAREMPRDWSRTRLLCSGGPLPEEIAAEILSCCGRGAVEIYGSTETGGVAFRGQTKEGRAAWRALSGVGARVEDGLLAVRSPWLPDENWHLTGDKAEANGAGGFHLQGRADRIAKILEKRVSLSEMDARLAEHPHVRASRVLPLPSEQGTERDVLGAVLELTDEGGLQLSRHGKAAFENEIRQHLRRHFDPIVLPRRWRMVERLPTDALGKVSHESLLKLFSMPLKPTQPEVLHRERHDSGGAVKLRVPVDLVYLEGHFPELPVVAGVCQLKWVIAEIESFLGQRQSVKMMEAVKYFELLLPGQEFNLEYSFNAETGKWTYRMFQDDGRKISSGRLQFSS